MDNAKLKELITEVISSNGQQQITGEVLQEVLLAIVDSVGTNSAPSTGSNVQSDWQEQDSLSPAFIKNKPTSLQSPGKLGIKINQKDALTDFDGSKDVTVQLSLAESVSINGVRHNVGSDGNIDLGDINVDSQHWYVGKKVSVLGDSISTYKGYNPEDERKPTYPSGNVNAVNKTWWGRIIERLQLELAMNDSWSGSTVWNTYTSDIPAGNVGPNVCMASLKRIQNLSANGTPDIILFYGGTNDLRNIKSSTNLGEFDPSKDYTTVDLESTTWTSFVDAYAAGVHRIMHYYPNAFVVTITPMFVAHATWRSERWLDAMCEQVRKISDYFGATYVDLRQCGAKITNTSALLLDGLHPNQVGMQLMADYIISQIQPALSNFTNIGATEPEIERLQQLETPIVTLSETGLASWAAVANATKYAYSLDGGIEVQTESLSMQLESGQTFKVKAVGDGVTYRDSEYSNTVTYKDADEVEPVQLSTPVVTVNSSGLASWAAVPNASGYSYSIDGASDVQTTYLSVQLSNGQAVRVKAIGDGVNYTDSSYSSSVKYDEVADPDAPTETVWYVDYAEQTGNYNFPNSAGAVAFRHSETYNKCIGVPINAIKVKVGGNGLLGYGRVAPDGDTYTHLGTIELTGETTDYAAATAQIFKLEKTITLAEGERLAIMEANLSGSGKIHVLTSGTATLDQVRTNIRSLNLSKDETWRLMLSIGYVV